MVTRKSRVTTIFCGSVVLALCATAAQVRAQDGELVLRYQQIASEIVNPEPLVVQVFRDGRMVVNFPSYTKQAGISERQLTQQDLQGLIASAERLLSFDTTGVTRLRQQAEDDARTTEGRVFAVSDDTTTVVEVHLGGQDNMISWSNVQGDARMFPDIPELQDLAAFERALLVVLGLIEPPPAVF